MSDKSIIPESALSKMTLTEVEAEAVAMGIDPLDHLANLMAALEPWQPTDPDIMAWRDRVVAFHKANPENGVTIPIPTPSALLPVWAVTSWAEIDHWPLVTLIYDGQQHAEGEFVTTIGSCTHIYFEHETDFDGTRHTAGVQVVEPIVCSGSWEPTTVAEVRAFSTVLNAAADELEAVSR